MPDKTVIWLRLALQDLDNMMRHLEKNADRAIAANMAERIWKAGQSLQVLSSRGRLGKVTGTREFVLTNAPYYLSYRVRGDIVEILRIIHFARQYPKQ